MKSVVDKIGPQILISETNRNSSYVRSSEGENTATPALFIKEKESPSQQGSEPFLKFRFIANRS